MDDLSESRLELNTSTQKFENTEIPLKSKNLLMGKFVKVVDHETTRKTIQINKSQFDFLIVELDNSKKIGFSSLIIRQNGFLFVLRLIIYQALIVGNCQLPGIQTTLLILLEAIYLISNLFKYLQVRHFKEKRLFFAKLSQSICLILFLWIIQRFSFDKDEN